MADPSALYPRPPEPTQGLLSGDPTKMLSALSTINQLARFHQVFGAQQAVGKAFQDALNPDGSIDRGRLVSGLKDPAAAFGAPAAIGTMLDQHGKMIENATRQFNLSGGQNKVVMDGLGALADKSDLSLEDVRHFVTTAARNSNIPSPILTGWLNGLPQEPGALRRALRSVQNMAIGSAGTATRVSGPPDVGGAPTSIPAGAIPPGGQIPGQISGQMPTGLGPGEQAASGLLARHREDATNFRGQVFPLEQAIPALQRLGKTGTGPGKEELNQFKSFLQSNGFGKFVDEGKVKDFDEAKKYLTDWVNQNGNSGTNDKLAAAFAGNPSVGISNAAAVDVAKSAMALRRMRHAQVLAFEESGLPEGQYAKWALKWNSTEDPRAYGFDMMEVAARKKLLGSFKNPADHDRFLASVLRAEKYKIMPENPGTGQ